MKSVRLVLVGAPRTKKNHSRMVRTKTARPLLLPSASWEAWCKRAVLALRPVLDRMGHSPISSPVNCRALFYRDARRGDAVGYYQGLADVLEHAGVLVNDVWIVSWDGSRLLCDVANPRVEIEITPTTELTHVF